jgi:hypothetical protein
VSSQKIRRPTDDAYYVEPWSENFLQGDVFKDVPLGFPMPPDALLMEDGVRRFLSGPFDAGLAMLLSPSCAIAAQGTDTAAAAYAHPARIMVPLRPVEELLAAEVVSDNNVGMLRADRLRNYLYLPENEHWPESAGLLYMPITLHHDVIALQRVTQLTGSAFWHLRAKLMAFFGGFLIDPTEFGPPPEPQDRSS